MKKTNKFLYNLFFILAAILERSIESDKNLAFERVLVHKTNVKEPDTIQNLMKSPSILDFFWD